MRVAFPGTGPVRGMLELDFREARQLSRASRLSANLCSCGSSFPPNESYEKLSRGKLKLRVFPFGRKSFRQLLPLLFNVRYQLFESVAG